MRCELELQLKRTPSHAGTIAAHFIAGDDPRVWLDEICTWGVSQAGLRLLVVPTSLAERTPCGVLIFSEQKVSRAASQRCLPFRRLAERLFLPVDARPSPRVTEKELIELLDSTYYYVWLPNRGLTKFATDEVLRVSDLLSVPPSGVRQTCWNVADHGIGLPQRMTSLRANVPLNIEELLTRGGDDIGGDADMLSEMPPVDDEPKDNVLSQSKQQLQKGLAQTAHWLGKQLDKLSPNQSGSPGGTASGGGGQSFGEKLQNWASQQMTQLSASMMAAQNKQLHRLLEMLNKDPDQGLRHAIPFGESSYRGIAPPDANLPTNTVDFSWGQLFGGRGAASFWQMPDDYQTRLTKKYRELAEREKRLGRYRRAAYVFAHLLGDFEAAAGALREGRHYREAAALYQQKLNRLITAADCLEEGGLWSEAIDLYEEHRYFEKAGDLAAKIDEHERSRSLYEQAASTAFQRSDHLEASRIQMQKLGDEDRALTTLANAWPGSSQAARCLEKEFELLIELGRHEQSRDRVATLKTQKLSSKLAVSAVDVLVKVVLNHPDPQVAKQGVDSCQTIVSGELVRGQSFEGRQMLQSMAQIRPEDTLLKRDCNRFALEQDKQRPTRASRPRTSKITSPLTAKRTFDLLRDGQKLRGAIRIFSQLLGIGCSPLCVVTSDWNGGNQIIRPATWKLRSDEEETPFLISPTPSPDRVFVRFIGDRTKPPVQVYGSIQVGDSAGVGDGVFGCSLSPARVLWTVRQGDWPSTLLVEAITQQGVVESQTINVADWRPTSPSNLPVSMHARSEGVFLGCGRYLFVTQPGSEFHRIEMPQDVVKLCGSMSKTVPRVAVTFEQGGKVIWWEGNHVAFEASFASDMIGPHAVFTRSNHLVAVNNDVIEVYTSRDRRVELVASLPAPFEEPVLDVIQAGSPRDFAVVLPSGRVHVFEIPR